MKARTLRTRVAAAAAAAIVLAIVLLGVTVSVLVERQLRAGLDRTLAARAGEVARLAATAPALLTAPGALEAPLGGRQLAVQVVDRRGRLVARSPALGARTLPLTGVARAAVERGRSGFADARLAGEPVRLFAAPLAEAGGVAAGGAVLVSSSTAEIDELLRRLRLLVLVAALGAAVLGAGAATLFTRRALRPLRRLSAAADEIERTGDPTRRLPRTEAGDEVGALAETLNGMLASLERAREAERRFVADASHELRSPLTALRGNAAFIARHGADAEVLADIEADAERLARLIDDLLALAREDAATAPEEPVRLDELARAAGAEHERVEVEATASVLVRGDAAALGRALDNLVRNALTHGPPDGQVTVSATARGRRARLTVADEGPGLRGPATDQAFERFWRASEARGRPGSGLGLAIVQATAERHGGRVEVDGSRFSLDLPLLDDAPLTELSDGRRTTDADLAKGPS